MPRPPRSSRLVATRARGFRWAAGLLAAVTLALPQEAAAQGAAALRDSLLDAFGTASWGSAQWGVLVVSLDTNDTLFAMEPAGALAPASNVKLLTTAAALHVLGPDYRFRTYLLSDAPVVDGVLQGDLVLYGTGDPGISDRFYASKDEVFQRLVDGLDAAGIRHVQGDLIADASFFPGPLRGSEWDPRDLNEHFTAAVSALSYNENVVSFRIQAGAVGAPPQVETVPPHSALKVENTAETVAGRARPRLAILREDPLEPVRVTGRMTAGSGDVWRQMTVAVPADFAGASLRATLEERDITLGGRVRTNDVPGAGVVQRVSAPALGRSGARILATHVSRPLADYLAVINKESNNHFAESVFRALGRASEGVGSPEASARSVAATLVQLGVDTTGMVQRDGSGLAATNRVSPGTFVATLAAMSEGPLWPEYWGSLPRAGTRRELGRMYRTAAADNLRAKTGTIEGVSALSGMVRSQDGERLAFSIMVNGSRSQTRAKRVENLMGARLADFRRPPSEVPTIAAETAPPSSRVTASGDRHRVSTGENLTAIARRYGVTIDEILQVNPRVNANRIMVGQWLEIPRMDG